MLKCTQDNAINIDNKCLSMHDQACSRSQHPLVLKLRLKPGRPTGSANQYGRQVITYLRGIRGGASSNKRYHHELPRQRIWPLEALVQVAEYAHRVCKLDANQRFKYGTIAATQKHFSGLRLAANTVRQCFHRHQSLVAEVAALRAGRLGRLCGLAGTRARMGLRRRTTQGRPIQCAGPIQELGQWHEKMRSQQLFVGDIDILLEFENILTEHKTALEAAITAEDLSSPLRAFWQKALQEITSRLARMQKSSKDREAVRIATLKMIKAGCYAVQKATHLTLEEQAGR